MPSSVHFKASISKLHISVKTMWLWDVLYYLSVIVWRYNETVVVDWVWNIFIKKRLKCTKKNHHHHHFSFLTPALKKVKFLSRKLSNIQIKWRFIWNHINSWCRQITKRAYKLSLKLEATNPHMSSCRAHRRLVPGCSVRCWCNLIEKKYKILLLVIKTCESLQQIWLELLTVCGVSEI